MPLMTYLQYFRPRSGRHFPVCTTSPNYFASKHAQMTDISSSSENTMGSNNGSLRSRIWAIWCNHRDTCGLICASLTWTFLIYSEYVFVVYVMATSSDTSLSSSYTTHVAIFTAFVVLALWSHLRCVTSDPGAIPPHTTPLFPPTTTSASTAAEENGDPNPLPLGTTCPSCQYSYKPSRAHHCSICQRCIFKMDHHCPWINNCVGMANQKYFLLFLFYTFWACFYALACLITKSLNCHTFGECFRIEDAPKNSLLSVVPVLHAIVLFTLSILFGIFTLAMMCAQCYAIYTDSTQIEQWQQQKSKMQTHRYRHVNINNDVPHPYSQPFPYPQLNPNVYSHPKTSTMTYASYPPSSVDNEGTAIEMHSLTDSQHRHNQDQNENSFSIQINSEDGGVDDVHYREPKDTDSDPLLQTAQRQILASLPTQLPPIYGFSNLLFICLGVPNLRTTLTSPIQLLASVFTFFLPTSIRFTEYERVCGYSTVTPPIDLRNYLEYPTSRSEINPYADDDIDTVGSAGSAHTRSPMGSTPPVQHPIQHHHSHGNFRSPRREIRASI